MTSPLDGLDAGPDVPPSAQPAATANPPGKKALSYRLDTRAGFLATLRSRLATETLPPGSAHAGSRPLASLATADPTGTSDPTLALLDSWAMVGDVLTFYQERIANEGYLRTATERLSVLELAALVGQKLGPGVAASAFLAFTVEDAPGSPATVLVPQGTQVRSIPGQNELPQIFETSIDLTARAELNSIPLRRGRPQDLASAANLYLAGTALRLSPGDRLLVVAGEGSGTKTAIGRITAALDDNDRQLTRVTLEAPLDLSSADLAGPGLPQVFALRESAGFFGQNAPRWGSLPKSDVLRSDPYPENDPSANWDTGRTVWTDSHTVLRSDGSDPTRPAVFLDHEVPGVVNGSWVVIAGQSLLTGSLLTAAYRVTGSTEGTLADYALTGPSTGLALASPSGGPLPKLTSRPDFDFRGSTAYVKSEPLGLADRPVDAPFPDAAEDGGLASLSLDVAVPALGPGQAVVVRGDLTAGGSAAIVALVQVATTETDPDQTLHTALSFQQPLLPPPPVPGDASVRFVRSTVTVSGNVVLATHGETVSEVLGSGDANVPNQAFTLTRPPLTQLSAAVPGGRASSLSVRVDGVLWQEALTLAGEGPESHSFVVEIDDIGRATVRFGDGLLGARLPTGQENVTATYRSGVGLAGLVGADTLQLLATRPLGIRSVTNPVPATGAAPPDGVEDGRANAPVAARTLGRILSFRDFEDFARSFAGISKARAAAIAGVHLTVAGTGGAAVDPGTALYQNLLQATEAARLPGPRLSIVSYAPLPMTIGAQIVVDPRYRQEDVFARAEAALLAAFAFDRRELEQPVYASDVLAVLQAVPGVVAVDLDAFHRTGSPPEVAPVLSARPARFAGGRVLPAELLLLTPGSVRLRGRTP